MGVITTSGEAMDRVEEHVEAAYKDFLLATHPDTWGSDDWKREYITKVRSLLEELRDVIKR